MRTFTPEIDQVLDQACMLLPGLWSFRREANPAVTEVFGASQSVVEAIPITPGQWVSYLNQCAAAHKRTLAKNGDQTATTGALEMNEQGRYEYKVFKSSELINRIEGYAMALVMLGADPEPFVYNKIDPNADQTRVQRKRTRETFSDCHPTPRRVKSYRRYLRRLWWRRFFLSPLTLISRLLGGGGGDTQNKPLP